MKINMAKRDEIIELLEKTVQTQKHELFLAGLKKILLEREILTTEQISYFRNELETRGPLLGAKLVATAWTDPSFKEFLLRDPKAAVLVCLGLKINQGPEFWVLENTASEHHVVVCTLCSCYPKAVLGLPPDWYKSFSYRSEMVANPRKILAEFGTYLPRDVKLNVVDSTADKRYMVLPQRPAGTDHLTHVELQELVERDNLIGVTLPTYQDRA